MPEHTYSARRPMTIGLVALAVLVLGFGSWAVASRLAGAVIASGEVEVDKNRQVVQHPDGGVVNELLVKEGDLVSAGDILVRLDAAERQSQMVVLNGQYADQLARHARLVAERDGADQIEFPPSLLSSASENVAIHDLIDGQTRLFSSRRRSLSTQIAQLEKRKTQIERQIDGFDAQKRALDQQLALLGEDLENQKTLLAKGLTQAPRVLSLQREEAALLGAIGEFEANRASAALQVTETELQILSLESEQREGAITELRELEPLMLDLGEKRARLQAELDRLDIRAPIAGIVHGMQVFTDREVIQPGAPVLYLVARDRPLVVTVQIDPIHVDQVYVNQGVYLRLTAFDGKTTPDLNAKITRVSADSFSDSSTGQSFYVAEIRLDPGEVDRLPDGVELIPGMPVTAFIRTEDRSPLSYLIAPLSAYFEKALRES